MEIIDPGHKYLLAGYDGADPQELTFMKRIDLNDPSKYPGNTSSYGGTNLQNVLRALIDRGQYLDNQISCTENRLIINYLTECNLLLESRAARRHGKFLKMSADEAISAPMCPQCGHVTCDHNQINNE